MSQSNIKWISLIVLLILFVKIEAQDELSKREIDFKNEAAYRQIEQLQKWYKNLIIYPDAPIYIFETKIFKDEPSSNGNVYRYVLIDPEDSYIYYDEDYYFDEFISPSDSTHHDAEVFLNKYFPDTSNNFFDQYLLNAKTYLHERKLNYYRIFFQVPIQTANFRAPKKFDATDTLFGLPEIYRMQYEFNFISISGEISPRNISFEEFLLQQDSIDEQKQYLDYLAKNYYELSNSSVWSLVNSEKYRMNFTKDDLPDSLLFLLNERFIWLKESVPEPFRNRVSKVELKFDYPGVGIFSASKLWTLNDNDTIFVSPWLLRAIFIRKVSEVFDRIGYLQTSENELGFPVRLVDRNGIIVNPDPDPSVTNILDEFVKPETYEVEMQLEDFWESILPSLDFILLHELAHIYLGANASEEDCDCEALKVLKTIFSRPGLGVFYDMMELLTQSQLQELWAIPENHYLEARYMKMIKLLRSEQPIECN